MYDTVIGILASRGYKVTFFEKVTVAAEYLDRQIDSKIVGFGGSVAVEELGYSN